MKQELIDDIRKDYEDMSRMVETEFSEAKEESVSRERKEKIKKVEDMYLDWLSSENLDIDDCILDEAIYENTKGQEIGETNKILMYISEMHYQTFMQLFGLNKGDNNPEEVYILYIDIENNDKYFVKKQNQKEFEKNNKVIVTYKNPEVNQGWNFDRNFHNLPVIRREFIRSTMYNKQEKAAKQFIKRYLNKAS